MFSSRKKAYQRIDDDFEDSFRQESCTSGLLESMNAGRSRLFGSLQGEQETLNPGTSASSYQDSPTRNHQAMEDGSLPINLPPLMASSSQMASQRWDHIDNLDMFFTHVYEYHQESGFLCIVLQKLFSLFFSFSSFLFFSTFFFQCVDYDVLFANKNTTTSGAKISGKRHFSDAVIDNCAGQLNPLVVVALLVAIIYWITRVVKYTNYVIEMHRIQHFYYTALNITDDQLVNLTWHAVVKRICDVQPRLHLMIHTERMTSIDVYHRILRYKNYMVAMVNKRILQPIFTVPFLGQVAYFPNGLKSKIERMLFYSSTAPWDGPNLREEYKMVETLEGLTAKLEKDCAFYGLVYLVMMPVLFPFQILVFIFSLAELLKRRPDELGMRRYSNYGRYLVRHFNELDHELSARLNRSHMFATAYMDQFFSPVMSIVAKNMMFVTAAIVSVLAILSAWDEDVIQIEHVLTVISAGSVILVASRGLVKDENLVWQPEVLMTHVASELHYLPGEWKGHAHAENVRTEFDQLFQMKWMFYLLEVSSPILTPFILLFWLRPRCAELIRFFHDYTDRVEGLGDVCSFSMMDVAKHGDPSWNAIAPKEGVKPEADPTAAIVTSHNRALDGKTELSVLHFKSTNPEWRPPAASARFLDRFRHRLGNDASSLPYHTPMATIAASTNFENGAEQPPMPVGRFGRNLLRESMHSIVPGNFRGAPSVRHPLLADGIHRIDGPVESVFSAAPSGGIINSLYHEKPHAAECLNESLKASGVDIDSAGAEMRIQALFLRGLHDESRYLQTRFGSNYGTSIAPHTMQSIMDMPEGYGRDGEELNGEQPTSSQAYGMTAMSELQMASSAAPVAASRLGFRAQTDEEIGRRHGSSGVPLDVTDEVDEDMPPGSFNC
ncbi:unnamed protein product [Caenorhabditis auriculariae]|uniref:Autophagy-related protein 9 n=1 Tax=Caenorhabditis auriculariae TaxID=2777116 RepID=A0A8S1HDI5_9PELO|nr:unnamed protein product [Caenorhabditis auriculariae]